MVRRGEVEVERGAEDPVVAEAAAVDVVAEQDQADVGVVVRVGAEAPDLLHEVALVDRRLQARVAAVEVAEHDQLVAAAGLGREDVDVLVEELLAAGEFGDGGAALEAAAAADAVLLPLLLDAVEEREVGGELALELARLGRVVELELGEEGVILLRRDEVGRLAHLDADALERGVVEDQLGAEELGEVVAEGRLVGVDLAVGGDELVDDLEQVAAALRVEVLEHLEAAQLELGEDEALRVLAVGDRLGHQVADLAVDLLEALDVVLVLVLDPLEAQLGVEGAAGVDPRGDEVAEEGPDEGLLADVELRVDVPQRGEVEDQGLDLLLGDGGIGVELDHDVAPQDIAGAARENGPNAGQGRAIACPPRSFVRFILR